MSVNLNEFKDYFKMFYDPKIKDSLYPIVGLTDEDIEKGISLRIEKRPEVEFVGDSFDREMVRDEILNWRELSQV